MFLIASYHSDAEPQPVVRSMNAFDFALSCSKNLGRVDSPRLNISEKLGRFGFPIEKGRLPPSRG